MLDKLLHIPFSKGKSQGTGSWDTSNLFMGIFIIWGSWSAVMGTSVLPYYFILKDKASSQAEPKLMASDSSLPPQDESIKPKSSKDVLHDPNQKEKVTRARLHHITISFFIALSWCHEFVNIVCLSVVHEETSYARASNRGGQTGHKTLLPEKRHHEGRVQGDFGQSRSEGNCVTLDVFFCGSFSISTSLYGVLRPK